MNIMDKWSKFKENLINEAKKITNYEDLKLVDKKILISVGAFLLILTILYYYYILVIYPSHKEAARKRASYENFTKEKSVYSSLSYNSPMKSYLGNGGIKLDKIPSKFMNTNFIPKDKKEMYIKAFDIIYDYIEEINKQNYSNALKYISPDFVKNNKITVESFANYNKEIYFEQNTFFIESVKEVSHNTYSVDLIIQNKDQIEVSFHTNYIIVEANGKLKLIINDLAKYLKNY